MSHQLIQLCALGHERKCGTYTGSENTGLVDPRLQLIDGIAACGEPGARIQLELRVRPWYALDRPVGGAPPFAFFPAALGFGGVGDTLEVKKGQEDGGKDGLDAGRFGCASRREHGRSVGRLSSSGW